MHGENTELTSSTEFDLSSFAVIAQLVANRVDETLSLEFKRKPSASVDLQKDDKRLLGEAVSGFANAQGGVLVIGVATASHFGLDRADSLIEIDEVERVAERYAAYIPQCVSPPVEGVTVEALVSSDRKGVIVVRVPRGQARPHMCKAPERHTYYRRVMSSFVPMEAYEVEEMMRLKTGPQLDFVTDFQTQGSIGGNRQGALLFGLANNSRVTAKFPYIEYYPEPNTPRLARYGLNGNGTNLWPKVSLGATRGVLFAAGADQVIHPKQSLFVSKLEFTQYHEDHLPYWGLDQLPDNEQLCLRFAFGCEDHPQRELEIYLSRPNFSQAFR